MNQFEKPQSNLEPVIESEDLEGKRVCMGCGAILGEFSGKGTSHGLCSVCREKYENGDPNFKEFIEKETQKARDKMKLDDFILDSCQEMVDIIEDDSLSHQEKLKKLKDSLPMFNAQSTSLLTMKSTTEQLEKALKRLKNSMETRRTILMKRLEE